MDALYDCNCKFLAGVVGLLRMHALRDLRSRTTFVPIWLVILRVTWKTTLAAVLRPCLTILRCLPCCCLPMVIPSSIGRMVLGFKVWSLVILPRRLVCLTMSSMVSFLVGIFPFPKSVKRLMKHWLNFPPSWRHTCRCVDDIFFFLCCSSRNSFRQTFEHTLPVVDLKFWIFTNNYLIC